MMNALACFAVAWWLKLDKVKTAHALSNTKGVNRRFQFKGEWGGVTIIDDYAHHPTEITACLNAAREMNKRVICLFQPHTYTRTRNHLEGFVESLSQADLVILLPIFAAREPFDPTISSETIAKMLKSRGANVLHFNNFLTCEKYLRNNCIPSDLLITMGAGDVYKVGENLLST